MTHEHNLKARDLVNCKQSTKPDSTWYEVTIFLLSESEPDVELEVSALKEDIVTSDPSCCACKSTLSEPYVRCAECSDVEICPNCFSNGAEIGEHKNNHNYIIIKNEFPVIYGSDWSARQELELMDVLIECGFGNWVDISRKLQNKSPEECKQHYLQNYIDNQSLPGLPKIKETEASLCGSEPVPYLYKLQDLEDPPRFANNTINYKLLAGYNAARSDFEVNFDNHAELLVSDLKFDEFSPGDKHYDLGRDLQAAIVNAYNHRLKERQRRRRIVRNHGLISFRRTMSWLQRYESTLTRPLIERLLTFMQLVGGMEFDYIIEGLHHAGELRNYMERLFQFRQNGLRKFHSVPTFKTLAKLRMDNDKERKQYMSNTEYCWQSVLPGCVLKTTPHVTPNVPQRKPPPPLIIQGLPGYEKLTAAERELCSNARVIPESYFDFKNLLITENKKCGSLRLAQARVLLKIDVNKTRKIYDFLAEEGYINKPAQ